MEAIEMLEIGGKNGGLVDKVARCRLDILAKAYLVLHCVKDVDVAEVCLTVLKLFSLITPPPLFSLLPLLFNRPCFTRNHFNQILFYLSPIEKVKFL